MSKLSERKIEKKPKVKKVRVKETKVITNQMVIDELVRRVKAYEIERLNEEEKSLEEILTSERGDKYRNKRWILSNFKILINFMLKHNLINIDEVIR